MKTAKLRYLAEDCDRHGNTRLYIRVPGRPKHRVKNQIGTPEFWEEYYRHSNLPPLLRDSNSTKPAFIYIIGFSSAPIKIGIATNANIRLAALQVGCPYRLELLRLVEVSSRRDAILIEKALHAHFADRQLVGEWFDVSVDEAGAEIASASRKVGTKFWVREEQSMSPDVPPNADEQESGTKTAEKP